MINLEYSTKQMISYFIIVNRNFTLYKDKLLINYIEKLKNILDNIDKKYVLSKVNISIFADFFVNHQVNTEEIISYAIVTFNRLNYYNREFTDEDIVKELETVMRIYSARTIKKEAVNILEKYNIKQQFAYT